MKTILIIAAVIFLTSAQDPNMRVFWGDRVQDKISRASLDGSGITTAVAEDVGAIHNLVAVPGDRVDNPPQLYWTDTEAGSIKTARGDNRGRVSDVLSDLLEPTSLQLFIDGDGEEWLYYAESGENGVIGRVKTDGTDREIVQTVPDGYAPRVAEIDIADARLIYCYMKTPQDGGIAHIAFDTTTGTVSGSPTVVLSETSFPTDMTASELYNPREIIASNETDTFYYVDLFNVYKVVGGTPSEWLSDRSAAWFDAEPLGDTLYWTEGLNDKTMYASNSFEEASASDLLVVLPTGLGSSPAGLAFAPYNSAGLLSSSLMLLFTAAVAAIGAAMTDGAW